MTFDDYKKAYGGMSVGQAFKKNSDDFMEWNFDNDVGTQTGYLYDYYHDDCKTQLKNVSPEVDKNKIPIKVKYLAHTSQTFNKDRITYHLQMRPSQTVNVPYYNEVFGDRYDADFPVGLYIDLKDNKGRYNRWLIVGGADYYDPQFSTFEILPCDYVFRWIHNNHKFEMAGVLRSQNSYNSGEWRDFVFTTPEDQIIMLLPMNRDSENLYYSKRLIIDNNVLTEPRAFKITKVNRISTKGIAHITMAQDQFDIEHDYIEKDEYGSVIGMWADYNSSGVIPTEKPVPNYDHITITHTGKAHVMKIGGNSKVFTATFFNGEIHVDYEKGKWEFTVNNNDATKLIEIVQNPTLQDNQIEIKLKDDESYIGEDLIVGYRTEQDVVGSITMNMQTL